MNLLMDPGAKFGLERTNEHLHRRRSVCGHELQILDRVTNISCSESSSNGRLTTRTLEKKITAFKKAPWNSSNQQHTPIVFIGLFSIYVSDWVDSFDWFQVGLRLVVFPTYFVVQFYE